MRKINPDVWVNYTFKRASEYDRVIISDCRQGNEYDKAIELGYVPIWVSSKLCTRIQRCIERDGKYPNITDWVNEAEKGADKNKFIVIENDLSLVELYKTIDDIILERKKYPLTSVK